MGFLLIFGLLIIVSVGGFFVGFFSNKEAGARSSGFTVGIVAALISIILWITVSATTVKTSTVVVPTAFGEVVKNKTLKPGLNFTAPWYNTDQVIDLSLQVVETKSQPDLKITSKDKLEMKVAVTHPYTLNPEYVDYLLGLYGLQGMKEKVAALVHDVGDYSTRNAFRHFTGTESSGIKTDSVQSLISNYLEKGVVDRFASQGIPREIASKLLKFSPSILKASNLPDRITKENNELQATIIEYSRKNQLLENAKKDAEINGQDGTGIRSFLDNAGINRNATPNEIANLIRANAELNRAESFRKLVEAGKAMNVTLTTQPVTTSAN